jgi:hypothetical protein
MRERITNEKDRIKKQHSEKEKELNENVDKEINLLKEKNFNEYTRI